MAEGLLAREPIANYGEFRAYHGRERRELAFEAFREGDGRAWLLRVPVAARDTMAGLLRGCRADDRRRAQARPQTPPVSCAVWLSDPRTS